MADDDWVSYFEEESSLNCDIDQEIHFVENESDEEIDILFQGSPSEQLLTSFEQFRPLLDVKHLDTKEIQSKNTNQIIENKSKGKNSTINPLTETYLNPKKERSSLFNYFSNCQLWSFNINEENQLYQEKYLKYENKSTKYLITLVIPILLVSFISLYLFVGFLFIGFILFGFGYYFDKQMDNEADQLLQNLENYQTQHLNYFREIRQCFGFIQEMQLVAQGFQR